jgi:ABC-type sugar transport system ATPase subunit
VRYVRDQHLKGQRRHVAHHRFNEMFLVHASTSPFYPLFASLDVAENLMLPPAVGPGGMSLETIFELFPNLKERLSSQGTKLSGGEQQMLAIARILRTGARLLLLDEPSEGLAPVIVQQIGAMIRQIKQRGFTVLLVEQNFRFAQTVADRHYVMEHGIRADLAIIHAWKADPEGNLIYRKTARNFNPMMATAARLTVAQVEHLVQPGEIDPDHIITPGVYVKRIIECPADFEKRIENRTITPKAA